MTGGVGTTDIDSSRRPTANGGVPDGQGEYFQAGLIDRAMLALAETTSIVFHSVIEIEGNLDLDGLGAAWESVLARHPILTARLGDDGWQSTGRHGSGTDNADLSIDRIEDRHRLTLSCNHAAFDGVASVILLADLRLAYLDVLAGRPPSSDVDWTPRTVEALAARRRVDPRHLVASSTRAVTRWRDLPGSTHRDPQRPVPPTSADDWHVMEFGPVLRAFDARRRRYRWPTDAVLVGVLEHAWSDVFGPPAGESGWLVARDLRPIFDMTRGVGNLGLIQGVALRDPAPDPETAIDQVAADLSAHPVPDGFWQGASRWPGVDWALRAGIGSGARLRYHRSLSNVGQLGAALDEWGAARLHRVYFVGPMAHPPYTSFIASGHGQSTLVTVRMSDSWLTPSHAESLQRAASAAAGIG